MKNLIGMLSMCFAGIAAGAYAILLVMPTIQTIGLVTDTKNVVSRNDEVCLAMVRYSTHDNATMSAVLPVPNTVCIYGPYGKQQQILLSYSVFDPNNVHVGPPVLGIGKLPDILGVTPLVICCIAYIGAIVQAVRLAWFIIGD